MAKSKPKAPPAAAAPEAPAADPAADPNTPSPPESAPPAPEQTQNQAGAGETQAAPAPNAPSAEGAAPPEPDAPSVPPDPAPPGANAPDPVIGLRITAKREGFRRAGRAWSKQPTEIPLAGLSDEQIRLLKDEHGHMLTVEEIVLP